MVEGHVDLGALYAALDAQRTERGLSWRQLAAEAGVSPSTLTRMAQGRRPDVDGFAALVQWLGLPADSFFRKATRKKQREPEPIAAISSLLRARRDLTPESAAALEDIIRAAYRRLRSAP